MKIPGRWARRLPYTCSGYPRVPRSIYRREKLAFRFRRPRRLAAQVPKDAGDDQAGAQKHEDIEGLVSHYCLTNAFQAGDAGVVVPLDFMRIPLIAVIGWWLYGEPLDVFVFLGAGLIITGILWNLRSEAARTSKSER